MTGSGRGKGPKQIGEVAQTVLQNARQTESRHDLDAALDRFDQVRAQRKAETLRRPPEGDEQPDFFVPAVHDVPTKDNRAMMDVAVFRLSKKVKRAADVIRHKLPDGHYVEVKSGVDGMATIWDYDIVLMMISYLTEGVNRFKAGRGALPDRHFRPYVSEILKFCRRSDGGKQYEAIVGVLDRLQGTTVKIHRPVKKGRGNRGGQGAVFTGAKGLIEGYEVLSESDSGKVTHVSITAPDWLYSQIVEGMQPNVLTVHPDYFLIEPGIGRFVYRLARQAAGKGQAKWSFKTLFERSGSSGELKKFAFTLRKLIEKDDLPEYALSEEAGQVGPLLVMRHRDAPSDAPFTSIDDSDSEQIGGS